MPRIMFAEPSRRVRPDVVHPSNKPFQRYHYKDAGEVKAVLPKSALTCLKQLTLTPLLQVLQGMQLALTKMGR